MSRPAADKRLERLLVMVPWVSEQEGPTVEEVCARFGISERELAADLELLFMCGLYPFTPDALIEADIVDGRVWIRFAEAFERPPTFTRQEAVSLLAAASAVAELPQNESNAALRSALHKLAGALGIEDDDVVEVELATPAADSLETVRKAAADRTALELDYYSYGRDAWSRRTIEPYRVFNSEGQWYVQARAAESGDVRNFRMDRMRNLQLLQRSFQLPDDVPEPRVYEPRPDDPEVVLELDPHARWVAEQYPAESSEVLSDGRVRVTLKVSEPLWLERLLLRVGTHATVVRGDVDLPSLAGRLLQRYQSPAETNPSQRRSEEP